MNTSKMLLSSTSKLREMKHNNVCAFYGICVNDSEVYLVTQYCVRGSLTDVLYDENSCLEMDEAFLGSLIHDLLKVIIVLFLLNAKY